MSPPGYLLDTSLLSELVKRVPNPAVVTWVDVHDEDTLFISVITLGELQKGVRKLPASERKEELRSWLAQDLVQRFGRRILPIDSAVALAWGALQGEAEQRGSKLPVVDSLIAATASVHNLTVVTRNVGDLQRCGVPVVNPWQPPTS
jgi:predicted nucleic acid-binding protein